MNRVSGPPRQPTGYFAIKKSIGSNQMIEFIFRRGKYLDLVFEVEDAQSLAQDLVGLLKGLWFERSAGMRKVGEGATGVSLRFTLGGDDFIDIRSNFISLILDKEACEYPATKLMSFVAAGSMFPAELQSFEKVGTQGSVMVYFFAAGSYGANA